MARRSFRDPIIVMCVTVLLLFNGSLCFSHTQSTGSQTSQKSSNQLADKVREQVNKFGIGKNVTVIMLDKTEYAGAISAIEVDHFVVSEVDRKQQITIRYDETRKLLSGYGGKGISGKRVHAKRSLVIGAAFIGGLFAIVLIATRGN